MGILNTPEMTLPEFKHRVEPFLHAFPHTGWAAAAQEILDCTDFCETTYPIDPEWWNEVSYHLSREAVQLGAYIIYGNQYRDEYKLDIDLHGMPDVYRKPFQMFVQEMVDVMVSGVDKGYTINDNYENGVGWQTAEGRMKFKEFMNLFLRDEINHSGRVLIKPATAAFVTWAAFIYHNDAYENWKSEQNLGEVTTPIRDKEREWC